MKQRFGEGTIKVRPGHLAREAWIYFRQSSLHQVEHDRESGARALRLDDRPRCTGRRYIENKRGSQ